MWKLSNNKKEIKNPGWTRIGKTIRRSYSGTITTLVCFYINRIHGCDKLITSLITSHSIIFM